MNRQEFFDRGVRHILQCGPAFGPNTAGEVQGRFLLESGAACFLGANLLEHLPAPKIRAMDAHDGTVSDESTDLLVSLFGVKSKRDETFIDECLSAHDLAPRSPRLFYASFRSSCQAIVKKYKLDDSVLSLLPRKA